MQPAVIVEWWGPYATLEDVRDENDAEVRLDCYEPFFDFEVAETGERGYGVVEYSIHPPHPRFRF